MAYSGGISTSVDRPGAPQNPLGANAPPAYQPGGQYYGAVGGQTGFGGYSLADPLGQSQAGMSAVLGMYQPMLTLNDALAGNQINSLQNQNYWTGQSLQNQAAGLNQGAMYQMANLGLDTQSLGVQQAALARQLAELPQQYGLQQQTFGVQSGQLDVQGKQIDLSQREDWMAAAQQQRALKGQATSAGTWNMPGTAQGRADIAGNLANQMTGIGLSRDQLALQRKQLGISEQQAALDYYEKTAGMGDAQKQLDIQGKRLGLSGSEVKTRLDNALNQLGISGQVSTEQMMGEISKIQQGELSPYTGLIGMLSQVANLPGLLGGQ